MKHCISWILFAESATDPTCACYHKAPSLAQERSCTRSHQRRLNRQRCPGVIAVKILLCTAYTDVTKVLPSVQYPNRMDYVCGECVLQAMGDAKDGRGCQPACKNGETVGRSEHG